MMVGAVLGAASMRRPLALVDSFIKHGRRPGAPSALVPAALDYCVFARGSAERGHPACCGPWGQAPAGPGPAAGAKARARALARPLLVAAASLLTDVAALADVLVGPE